jgi:signal transduction histidine kinase
VGFFVFFVLISLLFLYVVLRAWRRGRSHAQAFALGLLILLAGAMNDMALELDLLETIPLAHYTMFVYLLVYAYIFADKSNVLQRKSYKLAEELSAVKDHLEELVEVRTRELKTVSNQLEKQKKKLEVTNRDLVEAVNARNRLFSVIGHDVRAPIGYVRQALDMLLEDKDMKEEERIELLNMMAGTADTTYNLLDNLLVWGRSQTGKLKSNPVKFQLKELIDESVELVNLGVAEKKLKVEVFISEEHYVEADRDQFYVVVRNLLSNAMKFTPENGSIYISSKQQNGDMVLSVRDSGIGIPETIVSKLLDPKTHISTNGTRGEKGSGLGLKICYEIAHSNHGWMDIESSPGKGTTVLLGIPSAPLS